MSKIGALSHAVASPLWWTSERLLFFLVTSAVLCIAGAGWTAIATIRLRKYRRVAATMLAEAAKSRDQAESACRAKTDFLAAISHEMRTPANGIVGFTDLALKTDLSAEQREYLGMLRASAEWLMHVLNDVLDLSRIESGGLELKRAEFSLSECLHLAMKAVEPQAALKRLKTVVKVDWRIPSRIVGDPLRVRQVVANLLDNAVKFTSSGSVLLSAVLEAESAEATTLRIDVADTGVGMTPEQQANTFEAFTRAGAQSKNARLGSGLGLAICKKVAEAMGATLEVQSQIGAGTTFRFTVSFARAKNAAPGEIFARVRPRQAAELPAA